MIRKSPAERLIVSLIVDPRNYETDQIEKKVRRLHLDWIGPAYIAELREDLVPPDPFMPNNPRHEPSRKFLYQERLQYLFRPDEHAKKAKEILGKPRLKEFVESMTLSGAPPAIVAQALSSQMGFPCTKEVIERYMAHYWDLSLVDSTEMRALLSLRHIPRSEDPEELAHAALLKKASYVDSRVTAANLPHHPVAALISRMRMGFMPSKVDLAKLLELTRNTAILRTLESLSGSDASSKRALDYATVARIMSETLETVAVPEEKLRQQLATLSLKTNKEPVPLLQRLSKGAHTIDMQPTPEPSFDPEPEDADAPDDGSDPTDD